MRGGAFQPWSCFRYHCGMRGGGGGHCIWLGVLLHFLPTAAASLPRLDTPADFKDALNGMMSHSLAGYLEHAFPSAEVRPVRASQRSARGAPSMPSTAGTVTVV